MKQSTKIIIGVVVGFILMGYAFAQAKQVSKATPAKQPTIYIGIELHLGMPRDMIITRLASHYKTRKISAEAGVEGDEWLIEEKDSLTSIGQLGFTEGKLTYASRDWTQGGEDGYNFAHALRGAMTQIQKEGYEGCFFDVPSSQSPIAELEYLRLYCGPKKIVITIVNETERKYASVNEVLSSEKNR